jgi:hypothetical protein
MEPPEDLFRRARWAYERARILRALGTSSLAVPMVVASFGGCGRPSMSVLIGTALAALAGFLVWRGGDAGQAVMPGFVAGLVSLLFPLAACRALESAGIGGALPIASCVIGGLASGAIVTMFATRANGERGPFVLAGGAVAALGGSLGCLGTGAGGVIGMLVGVILVTPLGLLRPVRSL